MRTNAGYEIVAAVTVTKGTEIVIGHKTTSLGEQYVCWFCSNYIDYYWGKYCHSYEEALGFLTDRLEDYLGR